MSSETKCRRTQGGAPRSATAPDLTPRRHSLSSVTTLIPGERDRHDWVSCACVCLEIALFSCHFRGCDARPDEAKCLACLGHRQRVSICHTLCTCSVRLGSRAGWGHRLRKFGRARLISSWLLLRRSLAQPYRKSTESRSKRSKCLISPAPRQTCPHSIFPPGFLKWFGSTSSHTVRQTSLAVSFAVD